MGTKTEKTAALTFCVNVNVRRIVAFGCPRLGRDGPASSSGAGVPSALAPRSFSGVIAKILTLAEVVD